MAEQPVSGRGGRGGRGRLRVLHVVQNLNYGGMERLIADIVRRSDHDRFDMHVLALQYLGRFAEGLESSAGGLHRAPPMSRLSLLRPHRLARTIAAIAPDVVHTHSGVWYKASRAARMAGVRGVLHTDHGRPEHTPRLDLVLDRRAARRCDVVVAVSRELAGRLERAVVDRPDRLRVIPNGVDTEEHRPRPGETALAAEPGIEAERTVIGSIGRLEPVKGYDVMVRAFAHLVHTLRPAQRPALVIAGDGRERTRLESLARALDVAGNVFLLGWRDDVAALHATFDLFSMASHSEGTSVSLLEAMSAGLCPVVTAVGGNPTVLGQTLAHRLVPAADPGALAAAWAAALADPAARLRDGRAARQRVLDAYDVDRMVEAYEELYEEVGATARPG